MSENIQFEQAFYGSGVNGYQVLKNTNSQYDNIIEKICGEIGTPDGFSQVSPFFINYPYGEIVFMIYCTPGLPDKYNRKTLQFHIIYGNIQNCLNNDINAFSLFEQGVFSNRLPDICKRLTINSSRIKPHISGNAPFVWNKKALAIQCDAPQNELLKQLLGENALTYTWASFSFSPLPDFQLYAISKYAQTPNIACCDTKGDIIHKGDRIQENTEYSQMVLPTTTEKNQSNKVIWYIFLCASISLNVFFIYQRVTYKPQVIEKEIVKEIPVPGPEQTKIVEKIIQMPSPSVDTARLKREVLDELANSFPAKYRIKDWDNALSQSKNQLIKDMASDPQAMPYTFLQSIKSYVNFVNNKILNQTSKGE